MSALPKTVDAAATPATRTSTPAVSTPLPGSEDIQNEDYTPEMESSIQGPGFADAAAHAKAVGRSEHGGQIQVLELHSHNPVISYQNQLYSCTWSDMIGTNMFFSKHNDEVDSLRSTEEYDLLGTSRIKLIGKQAKATAKPRKEKGGQKHSAEDSRDEGIDVKSGKSLGNIRVGNAVINREIKKQAKFLEKLMDAKQAKGEKDNVRTIFKPRGVSSQPKLGGLKRKSAAQHSEASSREIEELNRRVVRGDADALMRLEEIYSELDDQALDEDTPQTPAAG